MMMIGFGRRRSYLVEIGHCNFVGFKLGILLCDHSFFGFRLERHKRIEFCRLVILAIIRFLIS